jgi:hypothetical protein
MCVELHPAAGKEEQLPVQFRENSGEGDKTFPVGIQEYYEMHPDGTGGPCQ